MTTKSTAQKVTQARKNAAIYAAAFATLAVISKFVLKSDVAFIITGSLLVLIGWYIFRVGAMHRKADAVAHERALSRRPSQVAHTFGVLGKYRVDGRTCYGLYADFAGRAVFVDLREDRFKAEREAFAKEIAASADRLQKEFQLYASKSRQLAEYEVSRLAIHVLGCYSKQPNSAEVYLLLDGQDDGLACLFDGTDFRDV